MYIRSATQEDLEEILEINKELECLQLKLLSSTENWNSARIQYDEYRLVDDEGINIAGAMSFDVHPNELTILTLAIRNSYQGLGIGKILIDEAIAIARHNNVPKINVGSLTYLGAKEFYTKMGFTHKEITNRKTIEAAHQFEMYI